MALVKLTGPTTKVQALTTSYLGAGNEVQIRGGRHIQIWCDDDARVLTVQHQAPGGGQIEAPGLSAKDVWTIDKAPSTELLIDIKADSGTPNANILVT